MVFLIEGRTSAVTTRSGAGLSTEHVHELRLFLEACPQFSKIEITRHSGQRADDFAARERTEFDRHFISAHANSQVVLMNSECHREDDGLAATGLLIAPGGIQNSAKQELPGGVPEEDTADDLVGRPVGDNIASLKKLFDA